MKFIKYSKSLLLLMMILTWFTVPMLGKDAFRRYLPAGLFIFLWLLELLILSLKNGNGGGGIKHFIPNFQG
jgi:hypothetical protein